MFQHSSNGNKTKCETLVMIIRTMCCLICWTEADRRHQSSLLQLPEEGDGEQRPTDGVQSSEDEEAGEGNLITR